MPYGLHQSNLLGDTQYIIRTLQLLASEVSFLINSSSVTRPWHVPSCSSRAPRSSCQNLVTNQI